MKTNKQKYERFSDEELQDVKSDITPTTAFETTSWMTKMDCRRVVSIPTEGKLPTKSPTPNDRERAEPEESAADMFKTYFSSVFPSIISSSIAVIQGLANIYFSSHMNEPSYIASIGMANVI